MEPPKRPSFSDLPKDIRFRYLPQFLAGVDFLSYCRISKEYLLLCREKKWWYLFIQQELSIAYSGDYPAIFYILYLKAHSIWANYLLSLPSKILYLLSRLPSRQITEITVHPQNILISYKFNEITLHVESEVYNSIFKMYVSGNSEGAVVDIQLDIQDVQPTEIYYFIQDSLHSKGDKNSILNYLNPIIHRLNLEPV